MQLTDHLCRLAEIWAETNDRSEATLGSKVAGDSKIFDRLGTGASCTIATFNKLLSFFRDGKNWKDGRIPNSAAELLDRLDNISTDAGSSSGKNEKVSRPVEASL